VLPPFSIKTLNDGRHQKCEGNVGQAPGHERRGLGKLVSVTIQCDYSIDVCIKHTT